MVKSFLPDTGQSDSASVELRACTDPESGRESVKVIVVGSPKGVVKIIHVLRVSIALYLAWNQYKRSH